MPVRQGSRLAARPLFAARLQACARALSAFANTTTVGLPSFHILESLRVQSCAEAAASLLQGGTCGQCLLVMAAGCCPPLSPQVGPAALITWRLVGCSSQGNPPSIAWACPVRRAAAPPVLPLLGWQGHVKHSARYRSRTEPGPDWLLILVTCCSRALNQAGWISGSTCCCFWGINTPQSFSDVQSLRCLCVRFVARAGHGIRLCYSYGGEARQAGSSAEC